MKMTLQEYYNFPEGVIPNLTGIPHWLEDKPNFPCPADMSYAFAYNKIAVLPPLDVSNVTNMSNMFYNCLKLTSVGDVSGWDVSNVTNMSNMFYNCLKLTSLDLSGWEVSNVTDMSNMFNFCSNLTSIGVVSGWDVSNVTNMSNMFNGCKSLTSVGDLTNWDTSKVTNMNQMFQDCNSLTSLPAINCSGISTKNYYPIYSYSDIKNFTDLGGFIGMKMSWNNNYGLAKCINLTYESCINILNGLYNFNEAGETPTSNQGKLKVHSNFLNLVGDEISIGTNKGWTITV